MEPAIPLTTTPLTVFPVVLLLIAGVLFVLATVGNGTLEKRQRYQSAGFVCLVLYWVLRLIGGLVK